MKTKLLKLLRKRISIIYYPSLKVYIVKGYGYETHHDSKKDAIAKRDCNILNIARERYIEYAKHIIIN